MKNVHNKIKEALATGDPQLRLREVGDRAIGDEWVYTSVIEDNTA